MGSIYKRMCLKILIHVDMAILNYLWPQDEFEIALDKGLRCTMENVNLRILIAEEQNKRSKAQAKLRSQILAGLYMKASWLQQTLGYDIHFYVVQL